MTNQDLIIYAVCAEYRVRRSSLLSQSRRQPLTEARHVAWFLIKKHLDWPYRRIAREFGKTSHSSINQSVESLRQKARTDRELFAHIYNIEHSPKIPATK
jgi:chromosomal replication initiator protein